MNKFFSSFKLLVMQFTALNTLQKKISFKIVNAEKKKVLEMKNKFPVALRLREREAREDHLHMNLFMLVD